MARLLGSDGWGQSGAAVTGFVLDKRGMPLAGVTVNLVADTEDASWEDPVVSQAVSGPTGQFDFTNLSKEVSRHWRLELPDYSMAEPLSIEIEEGHRYLVEFQGQW